MSALVEPGPLAGSPYAPVNEPDFEEMQKRTSAEKSTVMERQLALLEERYDLSDRPHASAAMARGKPVQTGVRVRLPSGTSWEDLTALSAHDPERSKALLAEAGLADGFETTLALPPPSYARRGGEIVAAQLRAVGIDAQIVNMEWAQWLEQVFKNKDFGLTIVSHTEPMDIGIYGRPEYYFGYDDPVMRALMAGVEATPDTAEQAALLKAAQERVAQNFVNVFLFQLAKTGVADARLKGLWVNSPTQANDMTAVYWAK